jgi:mannose-6-phosphate isomerase-like protein (cupin superfamily)
MNIAHGDSVFVAGPGGETPGPEPALLRLLTIIERQDFAAEREHYLRDYLEYLVPYRWLELYPPASSSEFDPRLQEDKLDFQKQNVRRFHIADSVLARGYVHVGGETIPFLRVTYRAGPDSKLWELAGRLGDHVKLWMRIGDIHTPEPIVVPYNPASDWYEIELWGWSAADLAVRLGAKGRASVERGGLVARPDLIRGRLDAFSRERLDGVDAAGVATDSLVHPVRPLRLEVAWATEDLSAWDSRGGQNYRYEFAMVVRGWDNYLSVGTAEAPHAGSGFLEYRNLLSNYGRFAGRGELGRQLMPWNRDALGTKQHGGRWEPFMAVDYMDMHILHGHAGIGLHRHRDNQEVFFMLEGRALIVSGDWCEHPPRERCFEIRSLRPGHLALVKGGELHGLMNASGRPVQLLEFGGYD